MSSNRSTFMGIATEVVTVCSAEICIIMPASNDHIEFTEKMVRTDSSL